MWNACGNWGGSRSSGRDCFAWGWAVFIISAAVATLTLVCVITFVTVAAVVLAGILATVLAGILAAVLAGIFTAVLAAVLVAVLAAVLASILAGILAAVLTADLALGSVGLALGAAILIVCAAVAVPTTLYIRTPLATAADRGGGRLGGQRTAATAWGSNGEATLSKLPLVFPMETVGRVLQKGGKLTSTV